MAITETNNGAGGVQAASRWQARRETANPSDDGVSLDAVFAGKGATTPSVPDNDRRLSGAIMKVLLSWEPEGGRGCHVRIIALN